MKFRTEVEINESGKKIGIEDCIFSIGSCFATEMHEKFSEGQIQSLNNPFGTIFNPYSIFQTIKQVYDAKEYQENDLILANENYISLDHHSSFDSRYVHKSLEKINQNIEEANQFLQSTDFVIITFGTSYIYEFLPKNKLVANCHKIPQKFFEKRFLSHQELTDSINKTIEILKDICRNDVQILFTVSPVRHTKDGIVENQLSKSKLITAIHESISGKENCRYLPVYEILMDDLRDYRFYKDDLIHPNYQAVQYIWGKFGNAYFSDEAKVFINENNKILTALNHKTNDDKNPKYQEFLDKINQKMIEQQKKVKHKIF
ncbi:GSCFA domain-containing protein [Epilithonimonas zeae]|uniref:GSCFA family protein n=1 Tax=Epilithonimonas zeae TaxID=1416779 RepID=A0A1N6E5V0_9FLAO|nr:GSCFA domain-containing protein [Epilithonimonas zeae]SIN78399.1 GSCFA family protein [Epilithonimonas zeae]